MSERADLATPELTAEQPGRYRLEELIAEGGQSRVWRAWDAHLGREVAFKQPIATGGTADRTVDRFLREARITAKLEHPNIVPVYEIGRRADGSHYCTQKLVRGPDGVGPARTLADEIAGAKTLEQRLALLPHFARLCYAVAHAHENGIVHRDVKPANVLLGGLGETVLADWGLAKIGPDRPTAGEPNTAGGAVIGTPIYRSPEQSMGGSVDERSDVWSLGIVLYEILTGRPPVGSLAGGLPEGDPPSALEEEPAAPRELAAIATKALRVSKRDRYRTAKSMAADVAAFLGGSRVGVYDYSVVELARLFFTRHKTVAAAVTVGVVLTAASSVVFWQQKKEIARESDQKRLELSRRLVQDAREAEQAFEWDYAAMLYALARKENDGPQARWGASLAANRQLPAVISRRIPAGVLSIAWRRDSSELAVGAADGAIRFLDPTGTEIRTLRNHVGSVAGIAFSPDGRQLASVGHDRRALLWDLEHPDAEPRLLLSVPDILNAIDFAPDGSAVAIAEETGRVRIVDPKSGALLRMLEAPGDKRPPIYSVAFAENGAVLAAGCWDNRLRLWDLRTGALRAEIDTSPGSRPPSASVLGLAVSPDGKTVVTSGRDRAVRAWRTDDGAPLTRLDGHAGKVYGVSFAPSDPRVIASGGADGTIRLWDVASSQPLVGESFGLRDDVRAVAFSPDGASLAWGTDSGSVGIRAVSVSRTLPPPGADRVYALAVSPDGGSFLRAENDQLLLDGPGDRHVAHTVANKLQMIAAFSPDGKTLAVHCDPVQVCLVDRDTFAEVRRIRGAGKNLLSIAFSPDGRRFALSGSESRIVQIFDATTGSLVRELAGHENTVFAVAWSPDGNTLASGSYDTTVLLWNPDTGERTGRLVGHSHGIRRLAFSPDGALLASASWDKTVRLWDVAGARLHRRLEGHEDHVFGVAFSPDGTWLASASWDGTLRIWSVDDGKELARFVADESRVHSVAVSRDGRSIWYAGLKTHRLELAPLGAPDDELARLAGVTGLDPERLRLARD